MKSRRVICTRPLRLPTLRLTVSKPFVVCNHLPKQPEVGPNSLQGLGAVIVYRSTLVNQYSFNYNVIINIKFYIKSKLIHIKNLMINNLYRVKCVLQHLSNF